MIQLKVYPNAGAPQEDAIFLDLYETQPIKLTLSIEDITSADATSVFSRTFKVPGTRENNFFFDNAFEIDGVDFDITIKKPAEILVDGAEFKTGHVRLQKIFVNQDLDKVDYELLFLGETRDFSSAIGELTMCQLTLTAFEWLRPDGSTYLEYDQNNVDEFSGDADYVKVTNSWNAFPEGALTAGVAGGDLLFPLIDHGNDYDSNGVLVSNQIALGSNATAGDTRAFNHLAYPIDPGRLKPMIRAKRLWDQIFENAGYTYESDFLFSDQFRHMYLSAFGNQATTAISVEQAVGQLFEVFEQGNNGNNDVDSFLYMSNIVFGDPSYNINIPDTGSQTGGSFFEATATATNSAYYVFEYGAQVDAAIENSDYGYTNVDCAVQLQAIEPNGTVHILDTGNWTSGGNWSFSSYDSRNTPSGGYLPNAVDIFKIEVVSNYSYDISSVAQCYWHCSAAPGGNYYPLRDLDCEYQQIDFIKDVITQFRLVMQPSIDRPSHFIIEPWQDFIGSGDIYDWSDKLVREKDFVSEPLFNTQSAQIEFTHAEDEDLINKFHQDNNKHAYGWLRFDSANELLKGKRDVEVVGIAPTPMDQINSFPHSSFVPNEEFIIPSIVEVTGENFQRLPIKPKSRFLFYNGKIPIDIGGDYRPWYMTSSSGSTAQTVIPLVSPYEYWPILNVAQDPGPPPVEGVSTLNLNFANDTRYFLEPDPNNTLAQEYGQLPNTLFQAFWARYVSSLYNKFSRRITAYFTLNNVDLQTLTFDDIIFIDGKYYRPEKIIDAQIGNRTAVKCELITVKDQRVYWPNDPLTGFSIVTTDGLCSGQLGSIQVTTNGTPAFTWVIGGTGQSGNYNAPVGQAPYTFTINDVPIGIDTLEVVDANGRTAIVTFEILNSVAQPVVSSHTKVDPTDCGTDGSSCNGEISVTPSGGSGAPYTINWQDGSTSFNRTGLCPGDYLYYVTDSNGCQSDVYEVELVCAFVQTNYECRRLLPSCNQLESAITIANALNVQNPQVGDVVSLVNDSNCYQVTGTTTQQAVTGISQLHADCATCQGAAQPISYKLESCLDSGVYMYVDMLITLTPGQVVSLVTASGCWTVIEESFTVATDSVTNVYATCSDCETPSTFGYYAFACDLLSFPPTVFQSTTVLNVGGVYKVQTGPFTGTCIEIIEVRPPQGEFIAPPQYKNCDACQGIVPPAQQRCTIISNPTIQSQQFTYIFNSQTQIDSVSPGQQVTICAEVGSVQGNVTVGTPGNVCQSPRACFTITPPDDCTAYIISNDGGQNPAPYSYTNCDGFTVTGNLALGTSVQVCAEDLPIIAAGMTLSLGSQAC